ncbi:DUF397 domain-containing protein [Streptomyces sp. 549]|uniref:DUF397 domain-containing protein n=1 Tax=Streptomyces sp. 549 TaxID=3049076 RepID=UPI0024C2D51D|nr:DUF397 domain-containing protein [Streptomyces sp. 549]MDK1472595.1 DUF397 domain-containing protein [Streptomyces sp. 549]
MLDRQAPLANWTKSSYSAVNGDCVEVRAYSRQVVAVRDSKNPHKSAFHSSTEAWSSFVGLVRQGLPR